jgi:urease accessory protein
VRAAARIRVERRHGRDEVVDRTAEPPFAVRRCVDTIMLAATAASPVGGDELELDVVIGSEATASIGSIGAMLVWPAPTPAVSSMTTTVAVGAGGRLVLAPEPTITVRGSNHRATTRVDLAEDATCELVEEYSLGRSGEAPGTIETSLRVERGGRALFHHDELLGALAEAGTTSVGVGTARHVTTALIVGEVAGDTATSVEAGGMAARLPVDDDAVVLLGVGIDRPTVRRLIDALRSTVGPPVRYG